jgi:hypothetical protein
MKAMILMIATLALASPAAQAANLTGKWAGKGTAVDHQGKTIACSSVVLTINQTATSFSVNSEFVCDGNKMSIPGATMEIRGNELFDKGQKAGTISDTAVDVVAKASGFIMQSKASFNPKSMNLRSVISTQQNPGTPVLKFEAALAR